MPRNPITTNTLFYGDNLPILREYIADESVDLVYLDPPFNSNRNYNVLFRDESGKESHAQIEAFEDTWHWDRAAEATYYELVTDAPAHVGRMTESLRQFIGPNQMLAYLVMMAARLIELHRVLKPTGSLYLHCDPTASHYLKVLLDTVFRPECFRSEITWKRTGLHGDSRTWSRISDTLFFYSKSNRFTWNIPYEKHSDAYISSHYANTTEAGRKFQLTSMLSPSPRPNMMYEWRGFPSPPMGWRFSKERMQELDNKGLIYYPKKADGTFDLSKRPRFIRFLDEQEGTIVSTIWTDIPPINARSQERLGYPTQKPLALLERILSASSNVGDVVLDPFCGCGTTIAAAQKLGRRWIGIDVTHLSIALLKYRLQQMFPGIAFQIVGEPEDVGAARQLAQDDRYQFQWWALSLVRAKPLGGQEGSKTGKKGSDRGIDGVITFLDDNSGKGKRVLVQVKSGHVKSGDIRDLRGTVERESAAMGVFITLEPATADMTREAASAGFYISPGWGRTYPKIQILTIAELLAGKQIDMPPEYGTFKLAQRIEQVPGTQLGFEVDS